MPTYSRERRGRSGHFGADLGFYQQQNVVPVDRGDANSVARRPDGSPDQADRTRPFEEPEETPAVLRLVGVRA